MMMVVAWKPGSTPRGVGWRGAPKSAPRWLTALHGGDEGSAWCWDPLLLDDGGVIKSQDLLITVVGAQGLLGQWWRRNGFSGDSTTGAGSSLMTPSSWEEAEMGEESMGTSG
jgi:hypothetical protein